VICQRFHHKSYRLAHFLSTGWLGALPTVISERLDKLYVCNECKAPFLFQSDVVEHKETTGHNKGFREIDFDLPAR
jgi:hypothetical protein